MISIQNIKEIVKPEFKRKKTENYSQASKRAREDLRTYRKIFTEFIEESSLSKEEKKILKLLLEKTKEVSWCQGLYDGLKL